MRIFATTLLLLAASIAAADPPTLTIPPEVRPSGQYVRLVPQTNAVSVVYVGLDGLDAFPSEELKDARRFVLDTRGVAKGRYRFVAVGAGDKGETTRVDFVVVVGDAPPGPTPPTPPDPPAPVVTAVKVLILEETADRPKLTQAQRAVLTGKPMHDFLDGKCAPDPNFATGKGWTVQDKDTGLAGLGAEWVGIRARADVSRLPSITIASEKGVVIYSGPLPADAAATQALINQYLPKTTSPKTLRKAG